MIRIRFVEPTTKTWARWVKECGDAKKALLAAFAWGAPFEISDLYRRKSIKKEVFLAKEGPFRGRCAYCESNIAGFQHGEIEHFRPKKAVTNEKDVPVAVECPDGVTREHPGYYWLAYDWSNLLASCITCNQPGEHGIGKRNRFPVRFAHYAATAAGLPEEQPLLINPADPGEDDPERHLSVDTETGAMIELSDRGKMCIDIFGLNVRDQLVKDRRTAMDAAKAKFAAVTHARGAGADAAGSELGAMYKGEYSFTLARRVQLRESLNLLNALVEAVQGGPG
jgi:hypothetical protein